MLLLLAVVQNEDAANLAKRLIDQSMRFTQINANGGLFSSGNVALLLGIEEEDYNQVISAIQATCHTRTIHVNAVSTPDPTFFTYLPVAVEVGGAVVFGVPVERFLPLSGNLAGAVTNPNEPVKGVETRPQTELFAEGEAKGEGGQMKLIVAIVQGEDADDVIRTLLAAEHRLTRINTTGGFLRRGNATLLIGVEPEKVDEVVNLIQSACRRRTESTPIHKGLPEYAANVFVLDASHFVRI
jgi:uncharacterized protein YaaQ